MVPLQSLSNESLAVSNRFYQLGSDGDGRNLLCHHSNNRVPAFTPCFVLAMPVHKRQSTRKKATS